MSPAPELGETSPTQLVAAPRAVPVPSPPSQIWVVWPKAEVIARVPHRASMSLRISDLVFMLISCGFGFELRANCLCRQGEKFNPTSLDTRPDKYCADHVNASKNLKWVGIFQSNLIPDRFNLIHADKKSRCFNYHQGIPIKITELLHGNHTTN